MSVFPERGDLWPVLEERLIAERAKDTPWHRGLGNLYWPDPGGNVRLVAKAASDLMFESFLLGSKYAEPSAKLVEGEVHGMVQQILGAPAGAATTLTAGGTESNFHAVKTARDWARENRPKAKRPTVLVPFTAHPSFDKAAQICGIEMKRVPERPDFRADIEAMAKAIDEDTIMIVGSAPQYPHGVVDDIPAIAALAQKHGLWCHVDGCVGGFLIPFLRKLGRKVPPFDFKDVPGVMSISADLHKFGLVLPHGISSFTLRDAANLRFQSFDFDQWSYGRYRLQTFAGSRSGHVVAAAWATMKHLGERGYLERARMIVGMAERLEAGIKRIPGLKMLVPFEAGPFVWHGDGVDTVAVAEAMETRGYAMSWCKKPPAMHLLLYPMEDERIVDGYLAALAESVEDVRSGKRKASAAQASYA